eukprot:scaffold10121_cov64-Cyclotella_meneghiniana.AAC.2
MVFRTTTGESRELGLYPRQVGTHRCQVYPIRLSVVAKADVGHHNSTSDLTANKNHNESVACADMDSKLWLVDGAISCDHAHTNQGRLLLFIVFSSSSLPHRKMKSTFVLLCPFLLR